MCAPYGLRHLCKNLAWKRFIRHDLITQDIQLLSGSQGQAANSKATQCRALICTKSLLLVMVCSRIWPCSFLCQKALCLTCRSLSKHFHAPPPHPQSGSINMDFTSAFWTPVNTTLGNRTLCPLSELNHVHFDLIVRKTHTTVTTDSALNICSA